MARTEPFKEFNIKKRKEDIGNNKRDKLSSSYSWILRVFVDYLLTLDQSKRPKIEQVLRYPIVRAELEYILNDFLPLT